MEDSSQFASDVGLRYRIKTWLGQSPLGGDTIPFILSVTIGIVTGFGAYIFIQLLDFIGDFTGEMRHEYGDIASIAILVVAGLLTGLIIARFALEAKGHGVPEVMEAIALRRGRIRPRVAIAKVIASAITIGAGGSAGREGPIVQVGSTLGSTAGQWARLSDEQIGMLVASGAAAGISATFNAPIAGSIFALEVILGRFSNHYLGMVVISSVSANVVSRVMLGENPAFIIPAYPLNSVWELPFYFVMAILCALGAVAFIRMLYKAEAIFDSWPVPLPLRTAVGMGLTGLVALSAPVVLGPGLEFIGEAIADDFSLAGSAMLLLLLLKLLATSFTLGAGNSGGVFAPSLFMGAMIGGIVGQIGQQIAPDIVINPGAFALVGMAAMMAGTARAPITAIIIVLEMSNDYRLILPLLMCVIVSTILSDLISTDTIYTRKLAERGIHLQSGHDVDLLQSVQVREIMSRDYTEVLPNMRLRELLDWFNQTHHHGFPIVNEERLLIGMVTLTDIERAQANQLSYDTLVSEIGTTGPLVTVYPDDPVQLALQRLNIYGIGRLPVVSPDDGHYLGMLRRENVLQAYDVALARKSIERHHQERFKLRQVKSNDFIEIQVAEESVMVGKMLAEFPLSDDCLVVSIQRGGQSIIAHGNTRIQPGDWVTAYAKSDQQRAVCELFGVPEDAIERLEPK